MITRFVLFCAALSFLPGLAVSGKTVSTMDEGLEVGDTLSLPQPKVFGTVSVEEALNARRSVRSFTDEDLSLAEISQLAWAAQGVTADGSWKRRTAPSAGALYPLQVYAVWHKRIWHYLPLVHGLEVKAEGVTQDDLAEASLGQSAIRSSPACFVLAGNYGVTAVKYGERAPRYVYMEVGHAAENLLLQAVALGLGGVPMGAFKDSEVKKLLKLPEAEDPLYVIPVGHRAGSNDD